MRSWPTDKVSLSVSSCSYIDSHRLCLLFPPLISPWPRLETALIKSLLGLLALASYWLTLRSYINPFLLICVSPYEYGLFSKWLYKFTLPLAKEECSLNRHPLQHKLPLVFLFLVFLTGVRWYLRVILICFSLMANDGEQFLKYLLAI